MKTKFIKKNILKVAIMNVIAGGACDMLGISTHMAFFVGIGVTLLSLCIWDCWYFYTDENK